MQDLNNKEIPVIDIFAGPGGLSEGFSQLSNFSDSKIVFKVKLSIEKDLIASKTLKLRSFFRSFSREDVPECYYDFIRGDETALEKIEAMHEWRESEKHVWNGTLGEILEEELHSRIKKSLNGNKDWVLLGGPPCQAYSLIGRARMSGLGHAVKSEDHSEDDLLQLKSEKQDEFLQDHRHTLYREYLRIVAVHQPAVFVMENVKGILSSKLPDGFDEFDKPKFKKAFNIIREDLKNPWKALVDDKLCKELKSYHEGDESEYDLYSFVKSSDEDLMNDLGDRDFTIHSEEYGIPQKRHRVIVLGVRKDILDKPLIISKMDPITVRDVIGNMPKLRSGLSKKEDTGDNWLQTRRDALPLRVLATCLSEKYKKEVSEILKRSKTKLSRGQAFKSCTAIISSHSKELKNWIEDDRLRGVIQHDTRAHMNSDLGRYLFVSIMGKAYKSSPKLDDWPRDLLPDHKNVFDDNGERSRNQSFKDRFKVQLYDGPASTITSHISKDGHYFIHPDPSQTRSLTMREAARLQTFPDNYYFCGNRTERYHQVGNAVPPYLALQLAKIVSDLF